MFVAETGKHHWRWLRHGVTTLSVRFVCISLIILLIHNAHLSEVSAEPTCIN